MSSFRLDEEENEKIYKLKPSNQKRIFYSMRADIKENNKKIPEGYVFLTEHFIIYCKKKAFGGLAIVRQVHLFDVQYLGIPDERTMNFEADDNGSVLNLVFSAAQGAVRHLTQAFMKNYICITMYLKESERMKFNPLTKSETPIFNPVMSPSQMFQLTYNAYCTYENAKYYHSVVQFVHFCIVSHSGIFDFTKIPLHDIEASFCNPLNLSPVFDALECFPLLKGIVLKGIGRPDFLIKVAALLCQSTTIRVLSVEDAMIEVGAEEFAYAISTNTKLKLEYLDLSGNPIRNIEAICAGLEKAKGNLFYLDLSNTSMDDSAVATLFRSMINNKHLWGITYLDLNGATISASTVEIIIEYMKNAYKGGYEIFNYLNLGTIKNGTENLLKALMKYDVSVHNLFLNGAKFDQSAENTLIDLISNSVSFKELDISNTKIKPEVIVNIIKAIQDNSKLINVSIHLGNLKLNGKKLQTVLRQIEKVPHRAWGTIDLTNNELVGQDVVSICQDLEGLTAVDELILNDNFTAKTKGLDEAFKALAKFGNLKNLRMRGGSKKMEGAIIPLLDLLKDTEVRSLDVANNCMGYQGIQAITRIVEDDKCLNKIEIDGAGKMNPEGLLQLLDVIAESNNIIDMTFPIEDVYLMMKSVSKSESKSFYNLLSTKQKAAQSAISRNMTAEGYPYSFTMQSIPEIDDLVDDIYGELEEDLKGKETTSHSEISLDFGLQFPYLENDEKPPVVLQNENKYSYHLREKSNMYVENSSDATKIAEMLEEIFAKYRKQRALEDERAEEEDDGEKRKGEK